MPGSFLVTKRYPGALRSSLRLGRPAHPVVASAWAAPVCPAHPVAIASIVPVPVVGRWCIDHPPDVVDGPWRGVDDALGDHDGCAIAAVTIPVIADIVVAPGERGAVDRASTANAAASFIGISIGVSCFCSHHNPLCMQIVVLQRRRSACRA